MKMWKEEDDWQTPTMRRTLRSDALGKKSTKPNAGIYMYSIYQIKHVLTMGKIPRLILPAQWWSNLEVEVAKTFMSVCEAFASVFGSHVPWLVLAAQVPTTQLAWGQSGHRDFSTELIGTGPFACACHHELFALARQALGLDNDTVWITVGFEYVWMIIGW